MAKKTLFGYRLYALKQSWKYGTETKDRDSECWLNFIEIDKKIQGGKIAKVHMMTFVIKNKNYNRVFKYNLNMLHNAFKGIEKFMNFGVNANLRSLSFKNFKSGKNIRIHPDFADALEEKNPIKQIYNLQKEKRSIKYDTPKE